MVRFEGEENAVRNDRDVQDLLAQVRRDPRMDNPRVLWINMERQAIAKNDGYPLHMYHETLAPVVVNNEREETAMAQAGFRREYKHRSFPCYMFRRNMHPKFQKSAEEKARIHALTPDAQRLEMATVNEGDYIEDRQVKTQEEADRLLNSPVNKAAGTGKWCFKVTDIEPFDEAPAEDPAVTIARLQGQLDALDKKRGKKEDAA